MRRLLLDDMKRQRVLPCPGPAIVAGRSHQRRFRVSRWLLLERAALPEPGTRAVMSSFPDGAGGSRKPLAYPLLTTRPTYQRCVRTRTGYNVMQKQPGVSTRPRNWTPA